MDWQSLLLSLISIVLTTLVGYLAKKLVNLIDAKITNTKHTKYLTDALDVVTRAVKSTYQTYVENLKNQNLFDAEAQKEALERAKNVAMTQLSKDTQSFIESNFGGIEVWVQESIEAALYDLKNQNKK